MDVTGFAFENYTYAIITTFQRGQRVFHVDPWKVYTKKYPSGIWKPTRRGTKLNLYPFVFFWMRPANERRRYNVTSSLVGWAHPQNVPSFLYFLRSSLLLYICCKMLYSHWKINMMTSSNGSIFRVTGPLCGDRWILRTKASNAELWCFLWSMLE